jgi:hypothetical protein
VVAQYRPHGCQASQARHPSTLARARGGSSRSGHLCRPGRRDSRIR